MTYFDTGERERDERRHWAPMEDAEWVDRFDGDPPVAWFAEDDPPEPAPKPVRCHRRVPKPGGVRGFDTCWERLDGGVCPVHGRR